MGTYIAAIQDIENVMHAYMNMITWFESERKFGRTLKFAPVTIAGKGLYMVTVGNYKKKLPKEVEFSFFTFIFINTQQPTKCNDVSESDLPSPT